MTIRKTLLVAFLGVGLLPAILLAGLAFVKSKAAVQTEIEGNLTVQAVSVSASIDKMIFERLQNAVTWHRLDIMQDIQVGDVDKRLSLFLSDLQQGYSDVYAELAALDTAGRIVASSHPAEVGQVAAPAVPWIDVPLSGTRVTLELPAGAHRDRVVMRAPIASAFTGKPLGQLQLTLDWNDVFEVLDRAGGEAGRMLAVLDAQGRVIAASEGLRRQGMMGSTALAGWREGAADRRVAVHPGGPVADSAVMVAVARAQGYAHLRSLGWTTLIIQPVALALAPVHRMTLIFAGLLALIGALTVFVALWVSREISRPIMGLTQFARGYMRDKVLQAPPSGGSGEVGELTEAFVRMVRDIDQSQRNLVRASKLAVVGEMSSVIAHEVRTPLGILRSSAQMLAREPGISDEGRELVGFIDSETERLNRLVSAMLDTARPRAPSVGPVDIDRLAGKTIALLGAQFDKRGIVVHKQVSAEDTVIECDEEQMTQVLLNVLLNALQILEHGGRIELAVHGDADTLTIDIADDGPGIDPAHRNRIFEAFFFQRDGGVGLGLAIVQQIVTAHGGDIEVDTSALGGALFRIRLPRQHTEPT
ncbi:HAMP domain-containing histidine kinase [Nitrogeniibacter mangrovi]|uniref:histidine kinase n=1 Tax=Nitrogeniibacter mangrovi TaxID=2016596 RepID=A0A6C1B034_9RHOO|nr:sensor histidine kinase [Nitrogeniibacter mangrovi]QID16255.1 HAMP domain-containing histidine kinase [Nitrogeniibacter mangrovi]